MKDAKIVTSVPLLHSTVGKMQGFSAKSTKNKGKRLGIKEKTVTL
jgi:hypothetical protein